MMVLQRSALQADRALRAKTLATGFSALSPCMTALRETLDAFVSRADGPLALPQTALGQLYVRFSRGPADDADYATFRDEFRACILSHWPYASGEVLLGERIGARKLHSVVTDAQALGLTAPLVDAVLTAAGAFPPDDPRAHNRKISSAETHADLPAEIPTWVDPGEMMASMGITKRAFANLEEDGVILPRTKAPRIIARWRLSDGQALRDRMRAVSRELSRDEVRWESIQHARKRKDVPVAQIITLALSEQIALGRDVGIKGYNAFRVNISDVNSLAKAMAQRFPGPEEFIGTISAASFGRSVGLRDGGHFRKLIEAGHVPAQSVKNPKTHALQWRMTPADVAAFHRKFLTTSTIKTEFGLHRNMIFARLKAAEALPFTLSGATVGSVWLREDVQQYFKAR